MRASDIKQLSILLVLLQPAEQAFSTTLSDPIEKTSKLCEHLIEERKYSDAIAKCMYGASQNDPRSARILGEMYLYGRGIKVDNQEAEAWLQRALDHGDEDANFSMGVINDLGLSGEENNPKAAEYFHKASELGNTNAMRVLGMLYLGDIDFPADYKKARHYLKKAWDRGNIKAAYYMADSYLMDTESPDYEQAHKWIKLAALKNDAKAFLRIAQLYETGLGVEKDLEESAHWLRVYIDSDAADPDLLPSARAHLTTVENKIRRNGSKVTTEPQDSQTQLQTTPVESVPNGDNTTPENINQIAARSSLMLYNTDFAGNPISQASAVIVTPEIAVTNCHVVEGGTLINANTYDNKVITAHPIWYNETEDLCLLQLSAPQPYPAKFGTGRNEMRVGQPVFALGSPEGFESTFSTGNISALRETGSSYQIQMTAPVSHGSSGGGLYNAKAELIGITTSVLEDAQNINFAIPVEAIVNALHTSREGRSIHVKLTNKTISINVPDGFKPFGLLNYGAARLIDAILPPDYLTLEILVSEEGFSKMANGEPSDEELPVILIAAPSDELREREDFSQTRERIRTQFNSLSTDPSNHPFMNDLSKIAEKFSVLIDKQVTLEMTHTPESIFVDTPEQIGISDISVSDMRVEGEEPFEEDGTRDTYLITKEDDLWIGVFLYDSGASYTFKEAQEIVQEVVRPN